MRTQGLVMLAIFVTTAMTGCVRRSQSTIRLERLDRKVRVSIDDELFTEFVYADETRPYLYPIIGPTGAAMTRNYPIVAGVAGEATDHRHHTSLWYAHGDVNGVDFWQRHGRMTPVGDATIEGDSLSFQFAMRSTAGETIGYCTTGVRFGVTDTGSRFIDFAIELSPVEDRELIFGDTKEGTMAIRTHPNLRLTRAPGAPTGRAINSAGVTGKQVWGKRAAWVDYWGRVDDHTVGVAILDHPDNPRYPTWWMARDYGLVAANPFGVSYFEDRPRGTGDLTVTRPVTFRYRFLFHEGDWEQAGIANAFRTWAQDGTSP
jgi:hypothetical protein